MSIDFFLTSLLVVLLPGTGVIYTLAIGLGQGFKASIWAALGCTLGILPAAGASIIGLAAILHTSALAFQTIKYLGVLYLFYMAWNILKEHGPLDVGEEKTTASHLGIILNGMLINVLNPKLSLFFLAFLPQFVVPTSPDATPMLIWLAFVFMALTFIIFIGYGAGASLARDYVISRPSVLSWLRRCFAGSFVFLGAKLALSSI